MFDDWGLATPIYEEKRVMSIENAKAMSILIYTKPDTGLAYQVSANHNFKPIILNAQ